MQFPSVRIAAHCCRSNAAQHPVVWAQSGLSLRPLSTAAMRTFRTFDQTEAIKANGPFRTFVDQWSVAAQRPETCLSSISQHLDPRKDCNAGQSAQSVTYRIICNELTLQNVW